MQRHLFAVIPLLIGSLFMITGRIFDDLPMTVFGLFFIIWGTVIHGNHMATVNRQERRSSTRS